MTRTASRNAGADTTVQRFAFGVDSGLERCWRAIRSSTVCPTAEAAVLPDDPKTISIEAVCALLYAALDDHSCLPANESDVVPILQNDCPFIEYTSSGGEPVRLFPCEHGYTRAALFSVVFYVWPFWIEH